MVYVFPVEFIIQKKEGSGTVMTLEDLSNALKSSGYEVEMVTPVLDKKARLFIRPPRHIVTGEDVRLETKEKKFTSKSLYNRDSNPPSFTEGGKLVKKDCVGDCAKCKGKCQT